MFLRKIRSSVLLLLTGCFVIAESGGCGSVDPSHSPSGSLAQPGHPEADVTIPLASEKRLEFYDTQSGVLVVESGPATDAPVAPKYSDLLHSGRYVDLVSALRPDLPTPDSLVKLQAKYPARSTDIEATSQRQPPPRKPDSVRVAPTDAGGSSPFSSGGGKPSGPHPDTSCNNNCCSAAWTLQTLCTAMPADDYDINLQASQYYWYLFDYGWSYSNDPDFNWYYIGAVCAAEGNSSWTVSINSVYWGNYGGTWTVPQGYYSLYNFVDGSCGKDFCAGASATTSVNSESNQELHTYCGGFQDF